ncbi:MAG: GNAT family N-acetyltransferase, partial [Rudaea sp.]
LVSPASVALVGASEREGSLGRVVYENLLAGGFAGPMYAVNPRHASVLRQRAFSTLQAIGAPVDLAIIATPQGAVAQVLEDASAARVKVAVVMTSPSAIDSEAARRWSDDVAAAARRNGIRIVGPGALGVIRPGAGLNATYCAPSALPGRLALIAQSGAVATAMLDFATPLGIGFSSVISVGGAIDVGFGELLDLLLIDPQTDGIVLHAEEITDARGFVSALRAAARTKPVVVLKAGRSLEAPATIPPDDVVDAALMRSGTVRVKTYMQLFAAARILARGRIPQGDRLAIVSNGRGPGVLAADSAADRRLELARFTEATARKLDALLEDDAPRTSPIDVHGDSPPSRLAEAVGIALDDPNVDAVVALHVPRPVQTGVAAARALADVARASTKPILGAWLGAIDRKEVHDALDAGRIANFYTPETAVEALSFLAEYRNNQALLLEVPPPQPEPVPPDLAPLETLRVALVDSARSELTCGETAQLLAAFGLGKYAVVDSLAAARRASAKLHFPVYLERDAIDTRSGARVARNGRALTRAWEDVAGASIDTATDDPPPRIVVREAPRDHGDATLALGIATDRRFGPVLFVRPAGANAPVQRRALMLAPLNARLASDLVAQAGGAPEGLKAGVLDALVDALTRLSALACALPWVVTLELDPVVVSGRRLVVGGARIDVDPRRKLMRGYPHMAIHPYPVELIGDVTLADGTVLHVRAIRPEDAALEQEFVNGLSEQSRYYRFFYRLNALTPAMLARFTQVDYDRELALVALADTAGAPAFVGVARYIANPDRTSAEFAVVVADAWQRRGVARILMRGLIVCAKRRGFSHLSGSILRANEPMIAFVRSLGFAIEDDPEDTAQVWATLPLT